MLPVMLRIVEDRFGACVLRKKFLAKKQTSAAKAASLRCLLAARVNSCPSRSPGLPVLAGGRLRRSAWGLRGLDLRVDQGRMGFRNAFDGVAGESGTGRGLCVCGLGYRDGAAAVAGAASGSGVDD